MREDSPDLGFSEGPQVSRYSNLKVLRLKGPLVFNFSTSRVLWLSASKDIQLVQKPTH